MRAVTSAPAVAEAVSLEVLPVVLSEPLAPVVLVEPLVDPMVLEVLLRSDDVVELVPGEELVLAPMLASEELPGDDVEAELVLLGELLVDEP
jgi:hypothetical protein